MKMSIRLANGLSFSGEFSAEKMKEFEKNRFFKKIESMKGLKTIRCNYDENCDFCRCKNQCGERKSKWLDLLSDYINSINNL